MERLMTGSWWPPAQVRVVQQPTAVSVVSPGRATGLTCYLVAHTTFTKLLTLNGTVSRSGHLIRFRRLTGKFSTPLPGIKLHRLILPPFS